jgi:D-beta-D-heptose 7-phosphate kinase/D-beta-D-heptose 1-phosphate adenosyltransferase
MDLEALLLRLPQARVLVLGDVILDRYVIGTASRLSPEAPIPVLRPSRWRAVLGGAANVAMNIASLGGQPVLAGVVGNDPGGTEIKGLLEPSGIKSQLVAIDSRPTTVKTRFMSGSHQLLRLDEEMTAPVDDPRFIDPLRLGALLSNIDVVVLSDYAKGVVTPALLERVVDCAGRRPVIADPKGLDFAAYRGVSVLTPNEHEVGLATRIDASTDSGAVAAGEQALRLTGGEAVLVTRSAKGVTLVRRGETALHLPTQAREVADVSGAGDTLVAALAVALGAGASLPEAASLANLAAGLAVAKLGTATVTAQELQAALHLNRFVVTDEKVVSVGQAASRAERWRAAGLRVGFANGCFDLIHPGHVRLLTEARAACDRLIVALNSDASVRRLKGPTRPVQNEAARASVMASLAPVDLVVLFEEDTPLELIRLLRPDVLVKGSDYGLDQVVGADLVMGWGGRVLLVDLEAGHSTSATIRRMARTE